MNLSRPISRVSLLFACALICCAGTAQTARGQQDAVAPGDYEQAAPTVPEQIPKDDPYLSSTGYIPPGTQPDPIHNLDTVRTTWWQIPQELKEHYVGDSPAQRVIFRDTLTGADVWLICRSPGDEYEGFYSTQRNFNANGAMLEIDRFTMDVDGSNARSMNELVAKEPDQSAVQSFIWDETDPDLCVYKRFNGCIVRHDMKTGDGTLLFEPGENVPGDCSVHFTDDGRYSLICRQKNRDKPFLLLGDGRGDVIREIELRSSSPDPTRDRMGGLRIYKDQHGEYYFSYSLNKTTSPNPFQAWLADLAGSSYIPLTDGVKLAEGVEISGERHFLRVAGRDPLQPSIGHAGMSPCERYLVGRNKTAFLCVQDLLKHQTRYLTYVPSCDHVDWSADINGFLTRTRAQVGLPIYRVDFPSGTAHRIVATNTSDHLSCFSYSHPSPDGTKCLYRSSMLGNLDMYLAVIRYPSPPQQVRIEREGDGVRLTWRKPELSREIRGYRVYRGTRSGGPYRPVTADAIEGESFADLTGLNNAYYVITSIEHSGIESRMFSEEVALGWQQRVNRFFEAETAILSFPMRALFLPASCSAAYAVARAYRDQFWHPCQGKAKAEWNIDLPTTAAYTLWARLRTHLVTEGEVSFAVDDTELTPFIAQVQNWRWVRLSDPLQMDEGTHTVSCSMAKPGCEIDKLLLTSDPEFLPRHMGNLPTEPPQTPSEVSAGWDEAGRYVLMQWEHASPPLFHHFEVHKGTSRGFEPSQSTLLGSPTRPAFVDPLPADNGEMFYRIVAVDTWANRSAMSGSVSVPEPNYAPTERLLVDLGEEHLRGGMKTAADTEATGGKHVILDGASQDGFVEIPLSLSPGRYLVWVRVRSKGRYQTARLEVTHAGQPQKCIVVGVARHLFSDFIWSWRRLQTVSRDTVPRRVPTAITVKEKGSSLRIEHLSGYAEVDQVLLTSSVHDLPAPEAVAFKPEDEYQLRRE